MCVCVCVLLQRGKERSGTGYVAHNDEGSVRICGLREWGYFGKYGIIDRYMMYTSVQFGSIQFSK